MAQENISVQLNDLLASQDFQAELLDKQGKPTDAENASIFTFDYTSSSGKNYGTMVVILDADNEMQVFYGDNLGRSMESRDKNEFFDFVQHLHKFANMRRWTFSPKNINQVKYTMQGLAAIKEGLFEGYYGTRKISYSGNPTEARLVINHNKTLGENDARFRYVESLFIETADHERFRLTFKNLAGGRAMLEHVRQGGKPYDVRGTHIAECVAEINTLARFNRASQTRVLEGVTAEIAGKAQHYYKSLKENLKRLASSRGYQAYFESWHPAESTLQEELVDSIKTMFIEQTLDSRIENALPLLARIQQQGNAMKEADIFESWINSMSEGTWNLPETPEQQNKLDELLSKELVVGPDATNATEQLYDLIGDDTLFDRLEELAARDPRANAWNDTEVIQRLKELGIEMPDTQAPAGTEGDAAPVDPAAAEPAPAAPVPQQPVAEGFMGNMIDKAKGMFGKKPAQQAGSAYPDGSSIKTPGADEWKQQYQQAVMAVKNAKTQQEYEAASDRASRIKDLLASKGIQVGPVLGQQGVAEAGPVTIGSKVPKSDTETFGLEPGRPYKINDPKDWKKGDRPRAIQQLIPTQDKKDHIRSRLGQHRAPVLPEQGVAEANIQPTGAKSRSHIGNLSNPTTNSVVHPSSGKEIGSITQQPNGEFYAHPSSTALTHSQGGTFATKDEAHQFIRNAHAKAVKNGTLSNKWLKSQPLPQFAKAQGVAESAELNAMRKAAGLPVLEGRMLDESGETLSHIMDRFKHEVDQFEKGGDLDSDLYYALFDYYSDHGEIPYGIAKGRDGDPFEWVTDRLDQELGTGNYATRLPEADVLNTFEVMNGFDAPVAEGSCNMTAEGSYCPEHGLMECGGMMEMGTVAGGMAPVVGEQSVAESQRDPLARIKSLALRK